jgi:hypothetical protein
VIPSGCFNEEKRKPDGRGENVKGEYRKEKGCDGKTCVFISNIT